MAQRKSLSKRTRFEVFKRDSFTCQYCGSKAPEVILEVDHIKAVANGGNDDMLNLATSCFSCNRGKSDVKLSDLSIVERQRAQIEELNIRRQQLEMILEWKEGLSNLTDDAVTKASEYFCNNTDFSMSEFGLKNLKSSINKFGLLNILNAFDTAKDKYFTGDDKSFEVTIKKTYAIAYLNAQPPHITKIAYAKGILNNRIYVNHAEAQKWMLEYYEQGYDLDELISFCKTVKNWTVFKEYINGLINELPF